MSAADLQVSWARPCVYSLQKEAASWRCIFLFAPSAALCPPWRNPPISSELATGIYTPSIPSGWGTPFLARGQFDMLTAGLRDWPLNFPIGGPPMSDFVFGKCFYLLVSPGGFTPQMIKTLKPPTLVIRTSVFRSPVKLACYHNPVYMLYTLNFGASVQPPLCSFENPALDKCGWMTYLFLFAFSSFFLSCLCLQASNCCLASHIAARVCACLYLCALCWGLQIISHQGRWQVVIWLIYWP